MESPGSILILGIGNDILKDDGIGPKVVSDLRKETFASGITFDTCCLGGLEVLERIREHDAVFIIDAMKTKEGIPGDINFFRPSDFQETLHLSNLHDVNFLTALEMAKRLDMETPRFIEIIAIEIIEDMEFGQTLSPELERKYPQIYQEILKYLQTAISSDLVSN
jgi:hydrogenase maturation protease